MGQIGTGLNKKKITLCTLKWQDLFTKNKHTEYATTFFGGYIYFG